MRLAWTVSKRRGHYMPIEIRPQKSYLKRTPAPWTISYDHRIHISIEHIRVDSIRSVTKQGGYLDHLKSHQAAKDRFAQCMVEYYPR
jgi:hypothetical protein